MGNVLVLHISCLVSSSLPTVSFQEVPFSTSPALWGPEALGGYHFSEQTFLLVQVNQPAGIFRDQAYQLNPLLLHYIKCLELEIPFGRRLVSTIPAP